MGVRHAPESLCGFDRILQTCFFILNQLNLPHKQNYSIRLI